MRTAMVSVLALAVGLWARAAPAADVPEGKWAYVVRVKMLAPIPMPEMRTEHAECGPLPPAPEDCTFSEFQLKGRTATWKAVCTFDGTRITGEGKATYTDKTMTGTVVLRGTVDDEPLHVVNETTGSLLGPCEAKKK